MIPQDALRVTGWDTLNPNTVSVRAEEYVMVHAKNTRDNIFGSRHKNRLSLSLERKRKRKVSPNFSIMAGHKRKSLANGQKG